MSDILQKIMKDVKKNVKGVHASVLADSDIATSRDWIKTPALDLNRILSGSLYKGIPTRNLVGIVGPEHTFKSSFMALCMANAQKNGFTPIVIDTEGGITGDFMNRWGMNPENVGYFYTPWVHEVKSILAQIRKNADPDERLIIGLDSAGGLDRLKSYEDAAKGDPKADQGILQKEIRSMLKLFLNIAITQDSIGIVCGHLYGDPGGGLYATDQVGGGKAMKLLPSILIKLRNKKKKEGTTIIGTDITATTIKNRYYPPFQDATISIDYKNGIDKYAGMVDLLEKMDDDTVKKAGSWYTIGDIKVQGKDKLNEAFEKDVSLLERINTWLERTGYSTINENVKEAEEIAEKGKEEEEEKPKKTTKKTTKKNERKTTKKK